MLDTADALLSAEARDGRTAGNRAAAADAATMLRVVRASLPVNVLRRQLDVSAVPGTAAQVDGDLVTRLRRWRNVASAVDAHEAADEIERLRELTSGEDFLIDAQADVIAGLQAEIERLRAALSLTVAALDDILRRAWLDCHPGRPAKAMLNPADLSSWESWQTTLAETREVLGGE